MPSVAKQARTVVLHGPTCGPGSGGGVGSATLSGRKVAFSITGDQRRSTVGPCMKAVFAYFFFS